jgi:hypothetical protein
MQPSDHLLPVPSRATPPHGQAEFRERAHFTAIRDIAEEFKRPYGEVSAAYRDMYLALAARAGVTDFVPIFVTRRMRASYRVPDILHTILRGRSPVLPSRQTKR